MLKLVKREARRLEETRKQSQAKKGKKGDDLDMWGKPDPESLKVAEINEFVRPAHIPRSVRRSKLPRAQKKARSIGVVELPHAGASYNPEAGEHAEAMRDAAGDIVAYKQWQAKKARLPGPVDPMLLRHVPEDSDDEVESEDEGGVAGGVVVTATHRLSKAQRNRMAAELKAREVRERAKQEKKKEKDIERAEQLARELENSEKRRAKERRKAEEEKQARDAAAKPVLKRGGKPAVKEPMALVPLPEELSGSLRQIRPVRLGHVLHERVDNATRRGVIERGKSIRRGLRKMMKPKVRRRERPATADKVRDLQESSKEKRAETKRLQRKLIDASR